MAKVALTYIVKDNSEYNLFEKSLQSFMPYFDGLYVAVTGTSGEHDKIHKLVKKYNGTSISTSPQTHPQIYHQWEDGKWEFARFQEARNVVWDLVPANKFDFISWADTDDLLQGGEEIHGMLEQSLQKKLGIVYCTYWYANTFDSKGNVEKTFIMHERERFIKPGVGKWKSHLHEVIIPFGEVKQTPYSYNKETGINLVWVHTAQMDRSTKSLQRNIKILELQAKEEDYKDPRTLFYLAKTYWDMGQEYYSNVEKYIDMYLPLSGWEEEIGNAWEYKGMVKNSQGDLNGAIQCFKESIKCFPENHTAYLKLIDTYFANNNIQKAKHFIKVYETIGPVTSKATIASPIEVEMLYTGVKWLEAHKDGKLDECMKWAEKRQQYIKDNLLEDTIMLKETELLAQAFLNLSTFYIKNKLWVELQTLVDMAPKAFYGEEFMKGIINKLPGVKHSDRSIVYFASFYQTHFEKWNGDSLQVGIGGSESAVIYLSEEWVKKGYDVTVYCDTDTDVIINGVKYVQYWKINFNDEFNIFISWRTPVFVPLVKCKKHMIDLHDKIYNQKDYTPEIVSKIDKVFFKSRDHATQIPEIPMEKRVVISNGIVL